MNVLFVNPPPMNYSSYIGSMGDGTGASYIQKSWPLGVLYLSSSIKKFVGDVNVKILDFTCYLQPHSNEESFNRYVDEMIERVDFVPDVIAWSILFSTSHDFFELVAPRLKEKWPAAVSIAGGGHPTNATAILLDSGLVDFIARGEAELSLSEFLRQLSAGVSINVKGIFDRAKLTKHGDKPSELGEFASDLDSLPIPDWELIDLAAYGSGTISRARDFGASTGAIIASIMTSRGCPFSCTFCGSHTVHGRKMRYHSIDRVVQEARMLNERYGANLFIPEDDLFTANKERTKSLLTAIKDLGIPNMEWQVPNALSVNTLNEEIIDLLASVGMRIFVLAIESGSVHVQNNIIKKRCNISRGPDIVRYIRSKSMFCRCYYIIGFPGETKDMINETISYAANLGADWANFNIAVPLLGSEMYDQFMEMGVLGDSQEVWKSNYLARAFDTPEISAIELKVLQYNANIIVNFCNHPLLIEKRYSEAMGVFSDILRSYPFHIFAKYNVAKCHREMGNIVAADQALSELLGLVESDARSQDQLARFGHLLPEMQAFCQAKSSLPG